MPNGIRQTGRLAALAEAIKSIQAREAANVPGTAVKHALDQVSSNAPLHAVTLIRSLCATPHYRKRTLTALRLTKMHRTVIHKNTPAINGMLRDVKEHVLVQPIMITPSQVEELKKEVEQRRNALDTLRNYKGNLLSVANVKFPMSRLKRDTFVAAIESHALRRIGREVDGIGEIGSGEVSSKKTTNDTKASSKAGKESKESSESGIEKGNESKTVRKKDELERDPALKRLQIQVTPKDKKLAEMTYNKLASSKLFTQQSVGKDKNKNKNKELKSDSGLSSAVTKVDPVLGSLKDRPLAAAALKLQPYYTYLPPMKKPSIGKSSLRRRSREALARREEFMRSLLAERKRVRNLLHLGSG